MQSYTFPSLFEHACSESYSRVVAEKRVKNEAYEEYIFQIAELKELIKKWLGDQRELVEQLENRAISASFGSISRAFRTASISSSGWALSKRLNRTPFPPKKRFLERVFIELFSGRQLYTA